MKIPTLKIIISAMLPFVIMFLNLFITGFVEIIAQGDLIAWLIQIILCIGTIILLLLLEKKYIDPFWHLACNGAFFIFATGAAFVAIPVIELYQNSYYNVLNSWDDSFMLRGLQWAFYWITICVQFVLHLIVRLTIAGYRKAVKELKKEN